MVFGFSSAPYSINNFTNSKLAFCTAPQSGLQVEEFNPSFRLAKALISEPCSIRIRTISRFFVLVNRVMNQVNLFSHNISNMTFFREIDCVCILLSDYKTFIFFIFRFMKNDKNVSEITWNKNWLDLDLNGIMQGCPVKWIFGFGCSSEFDQTFYHFFSFMNSCSVKGSLIIFIFKLGTQSFTSL